MTTPNSELKKKRAELWKLFDSTPEYKGDGRGTVDRFFDILIPYIHTETQRAVGEELEFAYKMATPEQKKALRELYDSRGVNKGLSWATINQSKVD